MAEKGWLLQGIKGPFFNSKKRIPQKIKHSKYTNITITICSMIASVFLTLMLVGVTVLSSITEIKQSELPNEKANLTLMDFGHKVSNDDFINNVCKNLF